MVKYPPPSTGINYNLVDKIEHDLGDRVIWHIIHSPEGTFVYDYQVIRANQQQHIERMCLDCRRVKVIGIKRLCNSCANIRKRTSNRQSQSKRRSTVRKTGFSSLRVEALTHPVSVSRYPEPFVGQLSSQKLPALPTNGDLVSDSKAQGRVCS
jgi:hypothetical protein